MNSRHRTTSRVEEASKLIPDDAPYADQLRALFQRAVSQAWEDEEYWIEEGKPYLRTFLRTTPVGLAIVDLANAILDTTLIPD